MADTSKKLYMEIQMEELKASLLDNDEEEDLDPLEEMMKEQAASKKKVKVYSDKDIELAKMYENIAECEIELLAFEKELTIIKANELKDLAEALNQELPDKDRQYAQELQGILISTWEHKVEVKKTHPLEQLDLIKETPLCEVVEKLCARFPDYEGDFAKDVKATFIDRLEALMSIKKDHIDEDIEDIYIAGIKPSYVKRIYKQVNGIK
ncbi:MAG: hypothetical protein COA44_08065 [Arcobacter sp.]|nr:MAG: hypothetical protein COA44_08065 [Arcobacter sp.]